MTERSRFWPSLLSRLARTSAALSLFGCGALVGESFDGYATRVGAASGGGSASTSAAGEGGESARAGEGGAHDSSGGAASGASGGKGANGGTSGVSGAVGIAGAGSGGEGGGGDEFVGGEAGHPSAGAGGAVSVDSSCAPAGGALITDMEGPWLIDSPFYANPQTQRGIFPIAGFFCGRTSALSDQETANCGSDSQIEATTSPDQVHGGKTALRAHANGTRRLLVKMDIARSFDASGFGGIHFWAKGSGPFVPGIDGGGDWSGLPDLQADVWQEYCLRWQDLVDSSTWAPRTFDGVLGTTQSIAFQVWNRSGSGDFLLLLDDLAFLPK